MRKTLAILLMVVLLLTACAPKAAQVQKPIILSTTTSTQDSGLLDELMPLFTEETGIEVKVVAVGTGAALQNGRDGNADVLLVHAKADEEKFVTEGYGKARFDVMYNDFILVGPAADPAQVKGLSAAQALQLIEAVQAPFVSRGDDSGTHKKELSIWKAAAITPQGNWYNAAGKGMGDVLTMTSEMEGYTLADRATYLAMKDNLELEILVEGSAELLNQYGVIAVSDKVNKDVNQVGAQKFVDWMLSADTQTKIGAFGKEKYGQALFFPNAKK